MNILVIGNGFDLAHGLPTKYTDFLEFVQVIKQALSKGKLTRIDWGNTNAEVKKFLISNKGNIQENLFSNGQIWEDLINDNIWIGYFLQCDMYEKEIWIDFESEICRIVKLIDNDMRKKGGIDTIVRNIKELFISRNTNLFTQPILTPDYFIDVTEPNPNQTIFRPENYRNH